MFQLAIARAYILANFSVEESPKYHLGELLISLSVQWCCLDDSVYIATKIIFNENPQNLACKIFAVFGVRNSVVHPPCTNTHRGTN